MSMLIGPFLRVVVQEVILASAVKVFAYGIVLHCPRTAECPGMACREEVVLLSNLACPIVHFCRVMSTVLS